MIEFTCPGCKAAHTANEAFADRRAKCVRCGASMYIPRGGGPATFAPHGVLDRGQTPPSGPMSGQSAADEEAPEAEESRPRRKPNRALLVGVGVLLLVAVGVAVYFLFLNKPPAPPTKKSDPPAPSKPAPPPEPPYEFVGPLKPPPLPPVPIYINAERLAEELARDRQGTNARYQGKLMEVQGECASFRSAKLFFRTISGEESVTAVLPDYLPKFRDQETGAPIAPPAMPALVGGWYSLVELPPPEQPVAGRPVAIRGTYRMDGEVIRGSVVRLSAPADSVYLGKTVVVAGRMNGAEDDDTGGKRVTLMKRAARDPVEVVGRLTKTASAALRAKSGDLIALSGKCSGRTNYEVRLENCVVVPVDAARLTALQLAADYEVDVNRFPPIKPNTPVVKVTADELANAYRDDPDKANARYQHQLLEVSGAVLKLDANVRQLRFETPTDNPLELRAEFTPTEFALFPQDEPLVAVRTEFRGAYRGQKVITLTDCVYRDPDADNPAVKKLTADYLPLRPGRSWEAVRVIHPEPARPDPKKPAVKPTPAQAVRLHYQVLPDGSVVGSVLQTGTFAADSLLQPDAPEVKWTGKPAKPGSPQARPVERVWLRATDRAIEIGSPTGKPEDPKTAGVEWKPYLRLGAKAGRAWDVEPAPGQLVQTTVESFFTDPQGRDAVRLVAVMTDTKRPDVQTQSTVVFARGVGEVSRVVKVIGKDGERVLSEQRLEGEPTVPKDIPGTGAVAGGLSAVPEPPTKTPAKGPTPK